jgi:hypothetical protein
MRLCRCFDLAIVLVLAATTISTSCWAFQLPQEYDYPDYEDYTIGGDGTTAAGADDYYGDQQQQDNLYYDYAQRQQMKRYVFMLFCFG